MEIIKFYKHRPTSTYAGAEVLLVMDDDGFYTVQILCVINDEDVEIMYEQAYTSELDAYELYERKVSVLKSLFA